MTRVTRPGKFSSLRVSLGDKLVIQADGALAVCALVALAVIFAIVVVSSATSDLLPLLTGPRPRT